MPNGQVKNHSKSKSLWVVETNTGHAIAHKLAPQRKSPNSIDADGMKAVDGTPISGHRSWWKIVNFSTADVEDDGNALTAGCILCIRVEEKEFGNITYDESLRWGEPL